MVNDIKDLNETLRYKKLYYDNKEIKMFKIYISVGFKQLAIVYIDNKEIGIESNKNRINNKIEKLYNALNNNDVSILPYNFKLSIE